MPKVPSDVFLTRLREYSKNPDAQLTQNLFDDGLDMSSVRFTEFIMTLEEDCDIDIDIGILDASIKTAGQLLERLNS